MFLDLDNGYFVMGDTFENVTFVCEVGVKFCIDSDRVKFEISDFSKDVISRTPSDFGEYVWIYHANNGKLEFFSKNVKGIGAHGITCNSIRFDRKQPER